MPYHHPDQPWLPGFGDIHVPKVTDKPPIEQRAGTRLQHGAKRSIYGPSGDGKYQVRHGVLDVANRVYQSGGERGNFIYRIRNLVSLAWSVWDQVHDQCDEIEIVHHDANTPTKERCYRLPVWVMRDTGQIYNHGIGDRIGWPAPWWEITDRDGRVVQPYGYPS